MPDVCNTKFGYPGKGFINWEEEIALAKQIPLNGAVETSVFCQAVGWKGYSLFSPCDMRVNCHKCIFTQFILDREMLKANHPCHPYMKKRAKDEGYADMWDEKLVLEVLDDMESFIQILGGTS